MSVTPELHQALRAIVGVLEKSGASYAVGGAVAMAFAGRLRGTRDVDVLAVVPALRWQEFADELTAAGFVMRDDQDRPGPIDIAGLRRQADDLGLYRIWWKDTKVEAFVPKVPLQDSILQRRVRVAFADFSMWITTAEDLILLKMIFHRPKDVEDVRHLLAANAQTLDVAYVTAWSVRTLDRSAEAELVDMMRRTGIRV